MIYEFSIFCEVYQMDCLLSFDLCNNSPIK